MLRYPRNFDAVFTPTVPADLSRLDYTCPVCKRRATNYDEWWFTHKLREDVAEKFQCRWCRRLLVLTPRRDLFGSYYELVSYAPVLYAG